MHTTLDQYWSHITIYYKVIEGFLDSVHKKISIEVFLNKLGPQKGINKSKSLHYF
jgi:hypothetical protein